MAISEKQLAANRANAKKSTGPRDTSKTRFNGIKHGLTATHALMPWEHKEDLLAVIEAFEDRYQPTDKVERLLIKNAAQAYWRLERSLRIETGILYTIANAECKANGLERTDMHAGHLEAVAFIKAEEFVDRYRRYDSHLQRSFDKALARVEKMASLRKPDAEPLPAYEPEPQPQPVMLKCASVNYARRRKNPIALEGDLLPHCEHEVAPGPQKPPDPAVTAA